MASLQRRDEHPKNPTTTGILREMKFRAGKLFGLIEQSEAGGRHINISNIEGLISILFYELFYGQLIELRFDLVNRNTLRCCPSMKYFANQCTANSFIDR